MNSQSRSKLWILPWFVWAAGLIPLWWLSREISRIRMATDQHESFSLFGDPIGVWQRRLVGSQKDLDSARARFRQTQQKVHAARPLTPAEEIGDPAFQGNLRLSVATLIDDRYRELFRLLELNPAQSQRLRDLLLSRTIGAGEGLPPLLPDNLQTERVDSATFAEDFDRKIRSILGAGEYRQYQAFAETLPARNLIDRIQRTLGAMATPLTPAQAAEIMAMASSSAAHEMPIVGDARAQAVGMAEAAISDEMTGRAEGFLTGKQLTVWNEICEQQKAQHAMDLMVKRTEEPQGN